MDERTAPQKSAPSGARVVVGFAVKAAHAEALRQIAEREDGTVSSVLRRWVARLLREEGAL